MSIERLNKAVTAAGFAMATPDEEAVAGGNQPERPNAEPSRAVVVIDNASHRTGVAETFASTASGWLKSYLPTFGGRQPA